MFGPWNVPASRGFKSSGVGVRSPDWKQERSMRKFAIRLMMLAMVSMALAAAPVLKAYAAGGDNPAPPASDGKKAKKKSSSIDDPAFIKGYRTAYAAIYD